LFPDVKGFVVVSYLYLIGSDNGINVSPLLTRFTSKLTGFFRASCSASSLNSPASVVRSAKRQIENKSFPLFEKGQGLLRNLEDLFGKSLTGRRKREG
jgi:hypothetical protein